MHSFVLMSRYVRVSGYGIQVLCLCFWFLCALGIGSSLVFNVDYQWYLLTDGCVKRMLWVSAHSRKVVNSACYANHFRLTPSRKAPRLPSRYYTHISNSLATDGTVIIGTLFWALFIEVDRECAIAEKRNNKISRLTQELLMCDLFKFSMHPCIWS